MLANGGFQELAALCRSPHNNDHSKDWCLFLGPPHFQALPHQLSCWSGYPQFVPSISACVVVSFRPTWYGDLDLVLSSSPSVLPYCQHRSLCQQSPVACLSSPASVCCTLSHTLPCGRCTSQCMGFIPRSSVLFWRSTNHQAHEHLLPSPLQPKDL